MSYWDERKAKLLNVIVFSVSAILLIFLCINLVQGNNILAICDVLLFIIVCIPSWILQLKQKYTFNLFMITGAFVIYTTLITILEYDVNRQTEHILPAISIMIIFMFDGWKKNLIFLIFPISFFTIRFVVMYRTFGAIEFQTLHIIYLIEFLIVYTIASFFKKDMMNFYDKLNMSNQTKTKLFRIISHDLKNPFSSLLGTSALQSRFIESGDMEKLKITSQIINASATKIYSLTQSLLDWSITQSETLEPKKEKINLTELTKNVIDFSNITAIHKEIEIEFLPSEALFATIDSTMTQIALRNIIMNALKFSKRGEKIIIRQIANNDFVKIEIEDFGVGISDENLETIFDANTIQSSYGTENEKGSGLGLLISKELLEKQDGLLSVTSQLEKGSVFSITLPVG
jgi:signal transduction histidine kinase